MNMSTSYKTQGNGPRECHAGQNCICINLTLPNDRSQGNVVLRNTKINTGCPTTYQTRQFFNNFTTNEDIATKFEADLPNCVRNMTS